LAEETDYRITLSLRFLPWININTKDKIKNVMLLGVPRLCLQFHASQHHEGWQKIAGRAIPSLAQSSLSGVLFI
jgi:hypothetical protein